MGHRRFVLLIGAGLTLFFGLCGAMLCGASIEKLLQRRWEPTPCVIASTSLVSVSGRLATGKDQGSRAGYRLDVAYRYEREGRNWTGDRWSLFDAGFGGKEELQEKAKVMPAGSRATCFVHPDDPSRSVLHRERVTELDYFLLALCLGVLPGGLLVWTVLSLRRRKRE